MAGVFQPIEGNRHFLEYNVIKDIAGVRALAERWPTSMVYSGFEIGMALPYPAVSIERDYAYVSHHPLAEAYIRRNPPPHNRPTWDLTSVLFAILGDRGYLDRSRTGKVTVATDGFTRFEETPRGNHCYLILRPEQKPPSSRPWCSFPVSRQAGSPRKPLKQDRARDASRLIRKEGTPRTKP